MIRTFSIALLMAALVSFSAAAFCADALTFKLEAPSLSDSAGQPAAAPTPKAEGASTAAIGRVGMVREKTGIYQLRSAKSRRYVTVKPRTPLAIVKNNDGWYGVLMINGRTGWISSKYVDLTGYELVASRPTLPAMVSRSGLPDRLGAAGDLIKTAMSFTGVRYVFGGANPATGMDCSAFVRKVFSQYGVNLPRTAREQAQVGTTVPFDQLQPGDRLYFACDSLQHRPLRHLRRRRLFRALLPLAPRGRSGQPLKRFLRQESGHREEIVAEHKMKADKILILGNSITTHPALENSGWAGADWGMAASAREKDYVHLLTKRFADIAGGKPPEAMVANIADFEREYDTYDIAAAFKKYAEFKADVVILAIGENVPELSSEEAQGLYRDALRRLVALLREGNSPSMVMRSSFWPAGTRDEIMRQVCAESGGIYVDISHLGADESNHAYSEHAFQRADVGSHPGDKGMASIADAIWDAISEGRIYMPPPRPPETRSCRCKPPGS